MDSLVLAVLIGFKTPSHSCNECGIPKILVTQVSLINAVKIVQMLGASHNNTTVLQHQQKANKLNDHIQAAYALVDVS